MTGVSGPGRLDVAVRKEGDGVVVALVGELDHGTADMAREALEAEISAGHTLLVVDCADLSFCDSTGLNVLLATRLRLQESGGEIRLAAMRSAVARVFEITGADTVFTVHPTVDRALGVAER
ncbi:anti-anti-sigma factor [Allostreptomyces psammosilenae]|uniref:Anti-sigma factor antagonist n=1 Tax=Allostreptomyces psammosilenae TaxID=1892865 RepID=A0A853A6F8_9ACTN|nr:anti-anti-sigma factor [Allostreptomyces psammosilenae]